MSASNDKATAAAGSVAARFSEWPQHDISDVKQKLFEIKGEMTVLKWALVLLSPLN